ncbi:hypothetical protein J7T55_003350 [Diaporthe amygdali]|uniref:uncharacterized protein n=1 Tax=Phomopsis amygdali TaxID=1214568 RepID=UPI0022FE299E|nr:uncharacterized protein J7T55_003350 [Diaporthe amygdali]KAJ0116936.1 hypothetical protein J7T55_003350 [Diaporthe amygdali]
MIVPAPMAADQKASGSACALSLELMDTVILHISALPGPRPWSRQFRFWYKKYNSELQSLSTGPCNETLEDYYASFDAPQGSFHSSQLLSVCYQHERCVYDGLSTDEQLNFQSAGIALGLLPTLISSLGISITEVALLSAHRPFLSLLLSLAAPAVWPLRIFEYNDPAHLLAPGPGRVEMQRLGPWAARALSLCEYVLAIAAVFSNFLLSWDMGNKTILSWGCTMTFGPLLWMSLPLVLHIPSALSYGIIAWQGIDDPSANYAFAWLIDGYTSSSQDIVQVQQWLQYCKANHDDRRPVSSGIRLNRFLLVGESIDTTVKFIQAQNLDKGDAEPYTTLSYCCMTKYSKLRRQAKLRWKMDDEDELAKEVAKMHHYDSNSFFTISAATAASCSEGFLHDHAMPHKGDYDLFGPYYFPVDLGVPEQPSNLKLLKTSNPIYTIESRACTLQEELLSHRLISFHDRFVRWSCRTASYGNYYRYNFRDLRGLLVDFVSGTEELSDYELAWSTVVVWRCVVEDYTARALSNERDKLPAISGIASVLSTPSDSSERSHQINFVAGHLVHCSLAHPLTVVDSSRLEIRYEPQDYFESGLVAIQLVWQHAWWVELESQKQNSQPSPYVAPSWSWASHVGGVSVMSYTNYQSYGTKYEAFDNLILKFWEKGLRVREVGVVLRNSEAPYGALTGGFNNSGRPHLPLG